MNDLIKLISSYSLLDIVIIILLTYAGIKWISEQIESAKKKWDDKKKEYHETQNKQEHNTAATEQRFQEIEKHVASDYERIQKYESHLFQIENTVKDLKSMIYEMRIQAMRKQILDFTNKAVNVTDCNISREAYAEIDRIYVEYESMMKELGRENSVIDYSYRCIKHSFETREINKLFLEDFYISPIESINRIKTNSVPENK